MHGQNKQGELGDNSKTDKDNPIQIKFANKIVKIAVGYEHTLALDETGKVWAWGKNNAGQLGLGLSAGTTSKVVPTLVPELTNIKHIACGRESSFAISDVGEVFGWGANTYGQLGTGTYSNSVMTPTKMSSVSGIIDISSGDEHTLLLRKDGKVFVVG